jgi:hypothetical protein
VIVADGLGGGEGIRIYVVYPANSSFWLNATKRSGEGSEEILPNKLRHFLLRSLRYFAASR